MDSKELLLDLLQKRGATYGKEVKRCRSGFSSDAVHDLRTSIRRLLAVLEVADFVTSTYKIEKLSKRLKDQLDGFSDLRDIQVMLKRLSDDVDGLPQLEPLKAYLETRAKNRERADEKQSRRIKKGSIQKRLLKIHDDVQDLSVGEIEGRLAQAVDVAYLTVIHRYGEIDPAQLTSIHRLRVAFKNFRYMVEAIHPCLPNFPEALLDEMQQYQTEMGNIHDIEVFLETLDEFAEEDNSYDAQPVRHVYQKALDDAIAAYLNDKGEVLRFWRATPLEAFPWQREPVKKEV